MRVDRSALSCSPRPRQMRNSLSSRQLRLALQSFSNAAHMSSRHVARGMLLYSRTLLPDWQEVPPRQSRR